MSRTDVVVTGFGCLGAYGLGAAALADALARGTPATSEIDRSAGYHRPGAATQVAACGQLDLSPWLSPAAARRMCAPSQFAVAAARLALADAHLEAWPADRTAVALATAFGPGVFTEQLGRQILTKGGRAASPFLFTECVANAPAGQVAIEIGARGPNTTICQREAGPLLALAAGAAELEFDRADIVLCGAVDEIGPLCHALLDRFRALARPGPDGELPRPFDRRRNGCLAGEGATMLVLEREAAARSRGARLLARVGPSARVFDPTATPAGFGRDASGLAAHLRARLAGELAEVDTVVSSACGARTGDALEAAVLRCALRHEPQVIAPKSVTGEFGGGTLAPALLALAGADFALPPACERPDPRLGIALASGRIEARRLLCTSNAAGGVTVWTVLTEP